MKLQVLFFGVLKDHFARARDVVELTEPATVATLLHLLQKDPSNEASVWRSIAVAVNREYAGPDTPLKDGDEVALLPPVSGGVEDAR